MTTTNSLNNSSSPFDVDNLRMSTNTLSSTNTDGDVILDPDGTGNVEIASGDLDVQAGAVVIDPGAATDSFVQFNESTTGKWRTGNDATDDSYRLSKGSALGTDDYFTTTSAGIVSMPLQSRFRAYTSATLTNVTGTGIPYTVVFNTEDYDINSDYDTSTGKYTAPVTGIYMMSATILFTGILSTHKRGHLNIVKAGSNFVTPLNLNTYAASVSGSYTCAGSMLVPLAASEQVEIQANVFGGTKVIDVSGSFFGGLLH